MNFNKHHLKPGSNIIIIGGGLTGLFTAVELIKLGFNVKVMEQAPQLRYEGGGLGIWPTGVAVLQEKLGEKLSTLAGNIHEIKAGRANGAAVTTLPLQIFDSINGKRNIFIVRKELQDSLAKLLPAENIYFNKKCINVSQNEQGVHAHFADGTTESADFLIAADGIFSKVRKSLGIDAQLRYTGLIAMGGIVECQGWQPDYHFIMDINRLSMLMPVGNNRYYTFMVRPLAQGEIKDIYKEPQQQMNLFANRSAEIDKIIGSLKQALTQPELAQHFFCQEIYDADPMPVWSQGKVVLLGEAAHPIGPILGLGTSFCLQGAETLINSLQQYPEDLSQAFSRYQKIQTARLNKYLAFERMDAANLLNPDPQAYEDRMELMSKTAPQELFAPMIQAFSHTEDEWLARI